MSREAKKGSVDSEVEVVDVVDIMRKRLEREIEWRVIEDYPENLVLGANVREKDKELVKGLAEAIASQGQLQECTGDTLLDGTYRVIAGQHRFWAVEQINEKIDEHNSKNPNDSIQRMRLRVRVADHELPPFRMLEIQIVENLHKDMKPEEEADAIDGLYTFYKQVFNQAEGSIADFARRIGRGEKKVRNAIRFMGVDAGVRELVEISKLQYSVATKVARLPKEKQLRAAVRIVEYGFSGERVDIFISNTLGEGHIPSFFSEMQELEEMNYRIAFRNAADKAAKDAAGYFIRILALLDFMEKPERAEMTDTIRDILAQFVLSADEFRDELEVKTPHLWQILKARVGELLHKAPRKR